MSVRVARSKKFLFALMLSVAFTTNVASADLAEDIKNSGVGESVLTENYTFSAPAGALAGSGRIYTIKSAVQAAIAGGGHAGISVASGQTLTIQDVSSISGFADTVNGGFLTNAGTVNINAINNNVTFTSNTVNGVYNDVYDNSGTINLNAGTYVEGTETKPRIITFNGAVNYVNYADPKYPVKGTLVLNGDSPVKGGEYHFNSDLGGKLNLRNGAVIRLGAYNHETGKAYGEEGYTVATDPNKQTYGALRLVEFNPGSNTDHNMVTLDLRNGHVDKHAFGIVTQNASVNHLLDVDMDATDGKKADWFTAESTTAVNGQILLGGFNLLSGSGSEQKIINLSRNSFRFAMALKPGFDIATNITYATEDHYDVRTIDYDFLSGNLILNANEFTPNGGTIDLVYKTSKEYLEGSHYHYTDTDISEDYDETNYPYVVVINGQVFYFKPKESSETKNDAVIDLAATASTAIREVTANDNYVFSKDGHYYSYSISALPKSIWDHTEAPDPAVGYNYYKVVFDTDSNEYTTKYYDINLRTDFMYDIDTTKWEKSDSTKAKDYWKTVPPANIPIASSIKTDPATGDLNSVSGMVAFYMPYKDFSTETRYYKYTYTVPDDYTKESRKVLNEDYITNKYFYGLTSGDNGGAVYNDKANGLNINADFIGNKSNKTTGDNNSGGGAIYNGSGATLGFISGTFIDNYAKQSGAAINNYKGDIKAIIGDFIGNNSDRAGGAIRNINGTIGMIHGQFIGNRAAVGNASQGWGGAIASKNDTGTVPEIKIIQGNFIANNVGKGGGAIDINGKLGTVIGDFIANKAGNDGGGAIRVEDGDIGSITGDFIGNSAHKGGAIQSQTKKSESHYGTIYGDFIGNKATNGNGGAINNDSGSSSFDGVYGDFINNSASANGGAIYNKGTMTRVSANFMANKAGGLGGAIYNESGTRALNLIADDYGDILFVGNTDSTGYNDIYNKGIINLNAEKNDSNTHSITFTGTITGSGGKIYINPDSGPQDGNYIFHNTISGNTLFLRNGAKIWLGGYNHETNKEYGETDYTVSATEGMQTYGSLDLDALTNDANGGVIDSQNENIDAHSLTSLTLGSDLSYKIDVKLDTPGADTLTATSVTANGHNIIIDAINILTDSTSSPTQVVLTTDKAHFENLYKLSDNIALNVTKATGVKGFYSVSYSDFGTISGYDANKGILVFEGSENATLADAVRGYGQAKTYTQSGTENVEKDLGNLQGGSLVVQGDGNYVINGGTKTGVTVGDTQTLKFNNISDVTGFNNDNTAVTNNGTLEITDSQFTSKIANNASMTLKGTNTLNGAITGDNGETVVSTGTTTVGSISQKAITIESTAKKLVVTNGLTTTNGVTNNKADGLEVQGGDINSNISGTGTTKITGTVTNETGKTLDNAITVDGGAKLTTGAGTLQKAVTNSGTVDLKAGTLGTTITGGNITISGDVTSNADNLAGTEINNASKTLTLTGGDIKAAITGNGTTIIGTDATVTNAIASNTIGNAVTLNSGSKLKTVAGAIANTITGETSPATTPIVELNGGTLGDYTISNSKIVIVDDVTANANNLAGTEINNASKTLTLTGGDIKAEITGDGTTAITGTVTNDGNKDLNNEITVAATTGALTTGASTLKNTVDNSGTVNLTAGTLTTGISGSGETKIIAGTGTVTVGTGGSIGNNLKITSGTLASDITKLGGTITNNATFNMTGNLSKNIAGASGTTILQSEAASVTNGTTIAGTLNVNGNTIAMNNSEYEKLTVGKLTGSGKLTLNVNANDNKADEIYIKNSGSDSVLTITTLNLTVPTDIETDLTKNFDEYEFSKQILTGSTGDAKIILGSGAVDPAYNVVDKAVTRIGTNTLATNNINWNDNYGVWKQSGLQNNKVEIVGNDTIKYSITKNWNGEKSYTSKAENLAIMNSYDDTDRTVNFNGIHADSTAQGTYTVTADIGTSSAGKMTLNGEKVGNSNTTIDLNNHAGFTLSNATELTLKNLDIKDKSTGKTPDNTIIANVTNNSAVINLDNVTLDGKISGSGFKINTSGNTNINGTVGGNVNNTGTLTSEVDKLLGNINNSGSFNASGSLGKTITGNGTTFVNSSLTLNNGANIDGTFNLNNGSVTVSNGSITSHNIGTLAGSGNLSLDINSGESAIDSFILNNTSSGTINITALNDIGSKPTAEGNYTFNVISGSGVTLNLADSIKTSSEWYQAETTSHGEHTADTIEADTDWNHIYYDRWTDTHTGKSLNVSGNSLVFNVINHQSQEKQSLGDTLSLVNKADLSSRTFKTDDATKTYELSSELGTTAAGNFTIQGKKSGSNISTVDLNNKSGFALTNATNLTLTDVKLTGANGDTVTLNNENASLKLNENAIIEGSINNILGSVDNKGSITGDVNNSGNFTNDGTIGGDLTNSGTLTSSVNNLQGTIENTGTFNATGELAKAISGNGTTKVNSTLTLNSGASVEGTLNMNGGAVTVSTNDTTSHNIGTLAGNGNLALDINSGTGAIDNFVLSNASSGTLTITSLNDIGTKPTEEGTYNYTVLTGSGVTLDLANSIKTSTDWYQAESTSHGPHTKDSIDVTTDWDKKYYDRWTDTTTGKSIDVSGNKLVYNVINHQSEQKSQLGDTLALVNQADIGARNFTTNDATKTYTLSSALGETKAGDITIQGKTNGTNTSVINFAGNSGFELNNNNTTVTLKDVEVKGANDTKGLVSGTAGTGVKVVLYNVNIHDNGAGIKTAGDVEIKGNSTIADKIQVNGTNSEIDVDGTNTVTLNSSLTGTGASNKLNISNGTVNLGNGASITGLDTTFNNTTLNLANDNTLNNLNATFNGNNNLNMANNSTNTLALGNLNLNGVLTMKIDADLANAQMDQISATSATIGAGGRIDVSKINLMSPTTEKQLDLLFTNDATLAGVVNYTGEGQIVYSPIYKYNTSYVQKDDGKGYFSFASAGNTPSDFNPAVMAASVTSIVTGYQNQTLAMHHGFYHMDRYMKYAKAYRFATENQNKVASLAPVTDLDMNKIPETSQAMWVIPYSTFERVNLKGGVGVNNIAYGMTYGGDSEMFDMGHGFKGVISGFVGYNGNHMTYNGISMTQNGGFLGGTLNVYKGNFFTGLTASTGASTGDADTMYGHDNITLLTAGIANKTGYNFEFMKGKIILQPSLFLGYSWVNTFDYTNSAEVKIKQDALNALQIAPGIKLIGNTKNGWQPYAGIDMVWNIFMGRNQATANEVVLPKLSERAYVQYGVGVQKTWADRFTGFLQAMVRNGGRNGVVLSAGFRWTFGKMSSKSAAAKNKKIIKQNKTVIK